MMGNNWFITIFVTMLILSATFFTLLTQQLFQIKESTMIA